MPRSRIRYEKTDAYEILVDSDQAIFETYKDLFLLAASVGYARNRSDEDPSRPDEIPWDVLQSNQKNSVVAAALAYAATEDPDSLTDENIQIDLLEKYAAEGIDIIEAQVIDRPGDPLDNMIEFLRRNRDEDSEESRRNILEEIEREFQEY